MGPVVVGGLGGSGTRAVTTLLELLGVTLGPDVSAAKDDLTFTLIFKHLYRRAGDLDRLLRLADRRIDLFTKLERGRPLSARDHALLADATARVAMRGHDDAGRGRGRWALDRRRAALAGRERHIGDAWGWKEPNTHVFLPILLERFPDLRYIHLVRHGLDMAFSANDTQLHIWGRHFGVQVTSDDASLGVERLRYWSAANLRASGAVKQHPDRCTIMRFEDVCRDPRDACRSLARFCGLSCDEQALDGSTELVRTPDGLGRYRDRDLSPFGPDDFRTLEAFGYEVVSGPGGSIGS